MNGLLLVVIANFCTLVVTILTSDIFKRKSTEPRQIFRGNVKRIVPYKSIGVIAVSLFSGTIAGFQYLNEKQEANLQKVKEESIRSHSDSIASARIEKSKDETINALGRYSLKYDSAQKEIERLVRDSSRKTVSIIQGPDPEFSFCVADPISPSDTTIDNIFFKINFCSYKAVSRNIKIACFLVTQNLSLTYQFQKIFFAIPSGFFVNSETGFTFKLSIPKDIVHTTKRVYVMMKGSYQNNDMTKIFPIEETILYDCLERRAGSPNDYLQSKIDETLKGAGIKIPK